MAILELDYMEYANDGAAQAAYVTSASETVDQQQTGINEPTFRVGDASDNEYRHAQSFIPSGNIFVSAVEVRENGAKDGNPTGNWTLRIETDNEGVPSGSLVNVNASVEVVPPGTNTIIKGTFSTPVPLNASTTYWLVVQCDNQATNDTWYLSGNDENYADGERAYSINGGSTWTTTALYDMYFKIYAFPALQSYSEDTIVQQGSYSLKAIATQTGSLNETLTKLGLSLDLSGKEEIKFWAYASRTGTNLQLQIHDSGGQTSTKDIVISSADEWTEITWDISAIADADKDDIDSIIIKVINADAANTFYIDNIYAQDVALDNAVFFGANF